MIAHFDGAARGNPGPAAIGVVLFDDKGKEVERFKECIGETTNNVAEYKGCLKALQIAAHHTDGVLHVYGDSELIIKQLRGEYRVRQEHLQKLFHEVKAREEAFQRVVYHHVPRSERRQSIADSLCNQALNFC